MTQQQTSNTMTLAEQLDILFDIFRAPNGKMFSVKEVSEAISMTPATVSRIKSGSVPDPRISTVKMFAKFFDISLDYFLCDTREECRAFLAHEKAQRAVPVLTLRSREMAADIIEDIQRMVEYIDLVEQSDRLHHFLDAD